LAKKSKGFFAAASKKVKAPPAIRKPATGKIKPLKLKKIKFK